MNYSLLKEMTMLKFYNRFKRVLASLFMATKSINVIDKPVEIIEPQPEVKEEQWFTRANDLVAEFVGEPVAIYSSNLSNPDPVAYQLPDGRMVATNSVEITKEKDGKSIEVVVERDGDEKHWESKEDFVDDVSLVQQHKDYLNNKRVQESKNADYVIGIDPYSTSNEENKSTFTVIKKKQNV
jgi:hypothetical protein